MQVSRVDVLSLLEQELGRVATSSVVRTVALRGEAGAGKTYLAQRLVQANHRRGGISLSGRADEFDADVPYAVFRDALRHLDGPELSAAAASALSRAREILDVRELDIAQAAAANGGDVPPPDETSDLPSDPASDPASDRPPDPTADITTNSTAILAAFANLAAELSRTAPLLIVLEDLQSADEASMALYAGLVRQFPDLPVLVLMTLRPGHLPRTGNLIRFTVRLERDDATATFLDLPPLDVEELRILVTDELKAEPDPGLLDFIALRSGGNAFLASELVTQLISGGGVDLNTSPVPLVGEPDFTSTQLRRLGRFFAAADEDTGLAQALSIFARFPVAQIELLAELTELDEERVRAAFDSLVAKKLVVPTMDGGFDFAFPVMRTSLYHSVGAAERRAMHARVAQRLQEQREGGAEIDATELATHLFASTIEGDTSGIDAAREAAIQALPRNPLRAAEWFGRAADLSPAGSHTRSLLIARQSLAFMLGGQTGMATQVIDRELALTGSSDRDPALVRVAAEVLFIASRSDEALELLDSLPDDSSAPMLLPALRANLLIQTGHPERGEEAFTLARTRPVPELPEQRIDSQMHLLEYASITGRSDDAFELHREAQTTLATLGRGYQAELNALSAMIAALGPIGLDIATAELSAVQQLRTGIRGISADGVADLAATAIGWLRGRWSDTLGSARLRIPMLHQQGAVRSEMVVRSVAVLMLSDLGETDEAAALLEQLRPAGTAYDGVAVAATARVLAAQGQARAAESVLREHLTRAAAARQYTFYGLVADELVSLLMPDRAEEAAQFARTAEAVVQPVSWPLLDIFTLRALGVATGNIEALRESVQLATIEDVPFERGKSLLALGEASPEEAVATLQQAAEIFKSFRATPWLQRTQEALRTRGVVTNGDAPRLTVAEARIAKLVSEGMSNKQVASALHYSAKTVEVYLSRIYAKTGHAGRFELIRAVYQGILTLPELTE